MAPKGRHSLIEVAKAIDEKRYWFSAPSRSLSEVIRIFEKLGNPKSETEAIDFILQGIKSLKADDFVQSVLQWNDPKCVADVYGAVIAGQPWFIKFRIDEDGLLEEISFHPPNKSMTTVSGTVIPEGDWQDEKQKMR